MVDGESLGQVTNVSKKAERLYGYQHASWLSRLTYWFVNPLIRWGSKG